jgi:hypothetical protein
MCLWREVEMSLFDGIAKKETATLEKLVSNHLQDFKDNPEIYFIQKWFGIYVQELTKRDKDLGYKYWRDFIVFRDKHITEKFQKQYPFAIKHTPHYKW